jgi:hypothetical protein
MDKREAVVAYFSVLSRYLEREPEADHRFSQSGYMLHRMSSKRVLFFLVLQNVDESDEIAYRRFHT